MRMKKILSFFILIQLFFTGTATAASTAVRSSCLRINWKLNFDLFKSHALQVYLQVAQRA